MILDDQNRLFSFIHLGVVSEEARSGMLQISNGLEILRCTGLDPTGWPGASGIRPAVDASKGLFVFIVNRLGLMFPQAAQHHDNGPNRFCSKDSPHEVTKNEKTHPFRRCTAERMVYRQK